MPKVILFDFWGTLVENGVYSPVRQVRNILRLQLPFQDYVTTFEECFMTKKQESLGEAFTEVCKTFGVEPEPFLIDRLIGMWNKNTLLAKPFPETIAVLEDLHQDFKIGIISNTDRFSVDQVLEKFKLRDYVDSVALSYEVGALKNDHELFDAALKSLKAKPADTIMVGDSVESDMKGAERAGIRGILVDRREARDFPDRISDLRGLRAKI